MNTTIYITKLNNSKYFIGKTNDNNFKIEDNEWTHKYKSKIEIIECISNCNDLDLNKYTIKYMLKYGIDNVRGGDFSKIKLTSTDKNYIKKLLVNYFEELLNLSDDTSEEELDYQYYKCKKIRRYGIK
jgi:hypothetical protein